MFLGESANRQATEVHNGLVGDDQSDDEGCSRPSRPIDCASMDLLVESDGRTSSDLDVLSTRNELDTIRELNQHLSGLHLPRDDGDEFVRRRRVQWVEDDDELIVSLRLINKANLEQMRLS